MLSKIIDWFLDLFCGKAITFKEYPAQNNWNGVPKPDLTWDEVRKGTESISPIIPMTFPIVPKLCPVCDWPIKEYKSAWSDHGDGYGQFDVRGDYCPEGHWTHLTWA